MCGIAGSLVWGLHDPHAESRVSAMLATMQHRGPDGKGVVSKGPCTLGLCRLAIMDPNAPTKPYSNAEGSVWSVANAEIYNAPAIASVLRRAGHPLRSEVDTEVIPHLWQNDAPALLEALNGMFAIALWDDRRNTLMLARDRVGEKPLYYWHGKNQLVFASEIRALLAHPSVPNALDPVALNRFFLHGFFPAPYSPFSVIRKLPAGHFLLARKGHVSIHTYWDQASYFTPSYHRSERELVSELDRRLSTAVERRRRSDTEVGVFLSGGIDSSAVLAHLSEQVGPGVPVFSLGHTDRSFDESSDARQTAAAFNAEFHQLILAEKDLEEGLQRVAAGFDEPLADASIIPTHLLSLYAHKHVKVVLSGEGADELFGGYPTYIGHQATRLLRHIPRSLRQSLMRLTSALTPVSMGNVGFDYLMQRFMTASDRPLIERHHVWFGILDPAKDCIFSTKINQLLGHDDAFASARQKLMDRDLPDDLARALYSDFTMYLQDGLLTKVDRATMLTSLEARAPFLDHELCEFVAGIPSRHKLNGITTKSILRKCLKQRLPKEVLARRKRGFNIPFSRWLLHGLGRQLESRFATERVEARGLFDPLKIQALLNAHLTRRSDHRKPLFALLIFDLWCDRMFGEGASVPVTQSELTRYEPTLIDLQRPDVPLVPLES